jgi:hypothetical protein
MEVRHRDVACALVWRRYVPFRTVESVSAAYYRERGLMLFHSRTHVPIWAIVFAVLALSGSRTIVGPDVARLLLGGLAAPAILFTVVSKLWKGMDSRRRNAQLLALADAQDVMRMDNDLG